MKGFLFVSVLAAVLFALKWVFARWAADRDPVDAKALEKANFPGGGGSGP